MRRGVRCAPRRNVLRLAHRQLFQTVLHSPSHASSFQNRGSASRRTWLFGPGHQQSAGRRLWRACAPARTPAHWRHEPVLQSVSRASSTCGNVASLASRCCCAPQRVAASRGRDRALAEQQAVEAGRGGEAAVGSFDYCSRSLGRMACLYDWSVGTNQPHSEGGHWMPRSAVVAKKVWVINLRLRPLSALTIHGLWRRLPGRSAMPPSGSCDGQSSSSVHPSGR